MSRLFYRSLLALWSVAMGVVVFSGCGGGNQSSSDAPSTGQPAATETTGAAGEESKSLDTSSASTPEGVTNLFFQAFFSGQDKKAWSLLTEKAQIATKENFIAQASDTVDWNITRKSLENDMAYIFVDVSDLTESGDRSTEELVFALRQDGNRWGVAGFSAGNLAVNFEETAVESLSADDSVQNSIEFDSSQGDAENAVERVAAVPDTQDLH